MKKLIIKTPDKGIIGCIHVLPLPGSPRYGDNVEMIIEQALKELEIYEECGLEGIIIENMHDVPYTRGYASPETTAAMAAVCFAARKATKLPLGIQILAAAAIESLAVAVACNLQFIRIEGYSFAHVADEGIIQSSAALMLRKRAELKADHIKVFADIKKKHSSHAITADMDIADIAEATEFMEADGVIVTGKTTGKAPDMNDLKMVREAVRLPVWIGSGMTEENVREYKSLADCMIVGSEFKKGGFWKNALDKKRIVRLKKRYEGQNG